ncbi:MAG: hypothetical protein KF824_05910 [Fimbriimonadaceae bacterium]|nr:MAG: hypothetical protein KF824_05910 [Fimbriimonadaceae bacterium]
MDAPHRSDSHKLFAIRAFHTLIYIILACSVLFILYCGVTGLSGAILGIALGLTLAECAIFVGFGFKCPLSAIALKYGAEEQNFSDLFLPRWLAHYTPAIFGTLLVVGLALIALRFLQTLG